MSLTDPGYPADNDSTRQVAFIEEEFDTIEEVDWLFRHQRRLSFTYGAIFFLVTLSIPYLSITSPYWYGTPIWGGFTLNYLVVAVLYHLFYFVLGLLYAIQANRVEQEMFATLDRRRFIPEYGKSLIPAKDLTPQSTVPGSEKREL